jgi:hypothetical protein
MLLGVVDISRAMVSKSRLGSARASLASAAELVVTPGRRDVQEAAFAEWTSGWWHKRNEFVRVRSNGSQDPASIVKNHCTPFLDERQ